jgi:hypothetical protein
MKPQTEAEPRILPNLENKFHKKPSHEILASFGISRIESIEESFGISQVFNACFPELRPYPDFSWRTGKEYFTRLHYTLEAFFHDYDATREHHYDMEKDWVDLCEADLDIDCMIEVIQMVLHGESVNDWAWEVVDRVFFIKWMVFFGQGDRMFVRDYFRKKTEGHEYEPRVEVENARIHERRSEDIKAEAARVGMMDEAPAQPAEISDEKVLAALATDKFVKISFLIKTLAILTITDARRLEGVLRGLAEKSAIEVTRKDGKSFYRRK